ALDSLQNRIDLALWPKALEDCFGFVADYQMFASEDELTASKNPDKTEADKISQKIASWTGVPDFSNSPELQPIGELYYFIKKTSGYALQLESILSSIANGNEEA
ncbi:MAG: hypothetical protein K2K55_00410, partial [Duncaniella sp.]|nr:hypothetical protein [Duncaniella sp.]